MTVNKSLLCTLLSIIFSGLLYAEEFSFSENSPFDMGRTVDIEEKDPTKIGKGSTALDFTPVDIVWLDVPITSYKATIIQSRQELYQQTEFSMDISAKYSFFSGSGNAAKFENISFDSDSITWMIKLYTNYGRTRLNKPKLSQEACKLLESGKIQEFRAKYGTHYVFQDTRMAMIVAIYNLKNISESSRKTFEFGLNAAINSGIFSANGQAQYKNIVEQAVEASQLTSEIKVIGGEMSQFSELLKNPLNIETFQQVSSSLSAKIDRSKSQAIKWAVEPISNLDFRASFPPNPMEVHRIRALQKLFLDYEEMSSMEGRLKQIVLKGSLPQELPPNYYMEKLKIARELIDEIVIQAESCYNSNWNKKTPNVDLIRLLPIKWPKVIEDKEKEELKKKLEKAEIDKQKAELEAEKQKLAREKAEEEEKAKPRRILRNDLIVKMKKDDPQFHTFNVWYTETRENPTSVKLEIVNEGGWEGWGSKDWAELVAFTPDKNTTQHISPGNTGSVTFRHKGGELKIELWAPNGVGWAGGGDYLLVSVPSSGFLEIQGLRDRNRK